MPLDDDQALADKLIHASNNNDNILSDREIQRGREVLSRIEDDLRKLDLDIGRPPGAKQHSDLGIHQDERIKKFLIALAAHRHLPGEILLQIFILCLPENADGVVSVPIRPHDVRWVLGQVCSRWRQLSRSEPRLWRRATIDMDWTRCRKDLTNALDILPPTDVSVVYRGDNQSITTQIIPNLWRIQELDLRSNITAYDELWRLVLPHSFAHLRYAAFCIEGGYKFSKYWPKRWEGAEPFSLAGNLRKLKLSSMAHSSAALLSLNIPWDQLTSLHIIALQDFTLGAVGNILSKCTALEELSVRSQSSDGSFFSDYPPDFLPSLQSLVVTRIIPQIVGEINCDLWAQLSSLDLEGAEFRSDGLVLHNILSQCTRLANLIVSVPYERERTATTASGYLLLPCLVSLTLKSVRATWIFESLITPMLTTLTIAHKSPIDLFPVQHMLVSSGCSLSSLTLIGYLGVGDTHPTGLFDLLIATPTIRNYSSYPTGTKDDILQGIGQGTIFPQLETFYCVPKSLDRFVDMAERRVVLDHQQGRSTLRKLEGCWPRPIHQDSAVKEAAESRMMALQTTYRVTCRVLWGPVDCCPTAVFFISRRAKLRYSAPQISDEM